MDNDPQQPAQGTPPTQRRFGASRVRPRVEVSRRPPAPTPVPPREDDAPVAEPVDTGYGGPIGGDAFGPRSFAGGRVRVYGCSPGCLLTSLLVSIFLTLLLNAIL
ncbi:MAG: hypothetical protein M3Q71_13530 [Chloroflexota bacterium]|nr:hypothetical protein [Chloroflexota bacterium]